LPLLINIKLYQGDCELRMKTCTGKFYITMHKCCYMSDLLLARTQNWILWNQ